MDIEKEIIEIKKCIRFLLMNIEAIKKASSTLCPDSSWDNEYHRNYDFYMESPKKILNELNEKDCSW